jgi:peptidoglycan L-alanyl-D-glutamate endopeptidase CwlK
MPHFSSKSKAQLMTCDHRLQKVFNEVIKHWDCTITEGQRGQEAQDEYYRTQKSKVQYPKSKHNGSPSKAVDALPYPIDWEDSERFYAFGGFVVGIAISMGIKIRWGGDWDSDHILTDQTFMDLPHFELID